MSVRAGEWKRERESEQKIGISAGEWFERKVKSIRKTSQDP